MVADPNREHARSEIGPPVTADPTPLSPDDPTFFRRVLDHNPSPIVVVDGYGTIAYANNAMLALGGWTSEQTIGTHILDHVCPEDVEWVTDAFVNMVYVDPDEAIDGRYWASVSVRLIASDGGVVPVEATGAGGLVDPSVGGVIFDVRPVARDAIVERVLAGIAAGEPVRD